MQLLIISYFLQAVIGLCDFEYPNIIASGTEEINFDIRIDNSNLEEEQNFGIGIWMKYMPLFHSSSDLIQNNESQFFIDGQNTVRSSENFIFSMKEFSTTNFFLILTQLLEEKEQRIRHKVYINFQQISDEIYFQFSNSNQEGNCILFFIYFQIGKKITDFRFFTIFDFKWNVQQFQGIPNLSEDIQIQSGGTHRQMKTNNKIILFKNFNGQLSSVFYIQDNIIENNFDSCLQQLMDSDICFDELYILADQTTNYNYFQQNTNRFVLNAWVKLDTLIETEKEILIMRITHNSNFRFFLEIYFQNQYYLKL